MATLTGVDDDVDAGEAVVGRYESLLQAELARGRLEAAGIAARLRDAHTAGLGPHLTQVIGGVKVVVGATDFDAAVGVLEIEPLEISDEDDALAARAETDATLRNKADDAARWAMFVAIFTVVFPFIGHLASLVLVWRAVDIGVPLRARGRRQAIAAVVIDVVTAALWIAVLRS